VDRLSSDPQFKDVKVFVVDYDSSKELLKQWKVGQRATLLAFKGKAETTRLVYDADADKIRRVFEAAR
jgi:hypothetical protein